MRIEFVGKTKGKVTKVGGFTIKLGQKDTLPAAQIRVMATVPNSILDEFSPGMREFLFERAKGSEKVQKQLEGVEVISDMPILREPGVKLGALHWEDEQTGCTFTVDRAITPVVLKDCRASKFKIAPKDGGSVQVFFTLTTGEIDRDTAGELVLLNKTDILFELTAAKVHGQADIEDAKEDAGASQQTGDGAAWPFPHSATSDKPAGKKSSRRTGSAVTPIKALKKADKTARHAKVE